MIPECVKKIPAAENFNIMFKHEFKKKVIESGKILLFLKELSKAKCIKDVVSFDFTRSIKNLADENDKLNVVIEELNKISFLKKADFSFKHTLGNVEKEVEWLMKMVKGI